MRIVSKQFIRVLLLAAVVAGFQHCGDPPTEVPEPHTGSLRIIAMDTSTIKSIFVDLDDEPYGKRPNPCVLENIATGTHKLSVSDESNAGVAAHVEVFHNLQTEARLTLLAEGPYLGRAAPRFSATTIDDQVVDLQQLKGKVVLLAFFEHT